MCRRGRGNITWIPENLHSVLSVNSLHNKSMISWWREEKWLAYQRYSFSSSHVRMSELYHKEDWAMKNWCFPIVVLEKTLGSPLDCKEIKPVNPKGNQPWIFIGRTDAEAEAPVLGPPDVKSLLIGKDWCWERLKAKGEGGSREWNG